MLPVEFRVCNAWFEGDYAGKPRGVVKTAMKSRDPIFVIVDQFTETNVHTGEGKVC